MIHGREIIVGLFGKKKRSESAMPDAKIYYSTPFGETTDGQKRLFLLERDGIQYFPVFRDVESMKGFYRRMRRAAYIIIEGDLKRVIETTRSIELLKNARIVIEPLSEHPVEIAPEEPI